MPKFIKAAPLHYLDNYHEKFKQSNELINIDYIVSIRPLRNSQDMLTVLITNDMEEYMVLAKDLEKALCTPSEHYIDCNQELIKQLLEKQ